MATLMILLQIATLINTATTIKFIKLPRQINVRFDVNGKW